MIWLQPNTNINMANTAWVIGAIVTGIEPVMKIAMENKIPIQYKLALSSAALTSAPSNRP